MDIELLYRRAGFTRKSLSKYIEVTEQTIKNWCKKGKAPKGIELHLTQLSNGLGYIAQEFDNFYISNDCIITPENEQLTAGDLRAIPFLRMTIKFLKKDKERLIMARDVPINKPSKTKIVNRLKKGSTKNVNYSLHSSP